jgi:hypothetical protein
MPQIPVLLLPEVHLDNDREAPYPLVLRGIVDCTQFVLHYSFL